jgi:hypothetical protein
MIDRYAGTQKTHILPLGNSRALVSVGKHLSLPAQSICFLKIQLDWAKLWKTKEAIMTRVGFEPTPFLTGEFGTVKEPKTSALDHSAISPSIVRFSRFNLMARNPKVLWWWWLLVVGFSRIRGTHGERLPNDHI